VHFTIFWNSAFSFNGPRRHTGGCEAVVARKALSIFLGDAAVHGVCFREQALVLLPLFPAERSGGLQA